MTETELLAKLKGMNIDSNFLRVIASEMGLSSLGASIAPWYYKGGRDITQVNGGVTSFYLDMLANGVTVIPALPPTYFYYGYFQFYIFDVHVDVNVNSRVELLMYGPSRISTSPGYSSTYLYQSYATPTGPGALQNPYIISQSVPQIFSFAEMKAVQTGAAATSQIGVTIEFIGYRYSTQ